MSDVIKSVSDVLRWSVWPVRFIAAASQLRVAVVGETIIDEFVEVTYEGHSMKSFCPVFRPRA